MWSVIDRNIVRWRMTVLFTEPLIASKYKKKNKTINTHICIILHQVKEHNIFSLQSNSCMQRKSCFGFEHPEQQWCAHMCEVFTCKIILKNTKSFVNY